ncbi:GAF domain-containing protein [Aerophototrophica crusticola]|uniref:histidine kinase n=1 Tax=Aerophototrophica crusticola TaxID=1709002 RepID=A0A858RA80_9PROT|nr:GAF domain-containing protein [Rhodospirillaceae bacterium B3]
MSSNQGPQAEASAPPDRAGVEPPELLADLAWSLRDRDPPRADRVAQDLLARLGQRDDTGAASMRARAELVRAWAAMNAGHPAAAHLALDRARAGFTQLQDTKGLADTDLAAADLGLLEGDTAERVARLSAAEQAYQALGEVAAWSEVVSRRTAILLYQGKAAAARELAESALAAARRVADAPAEAAALYALALIALDRGTHALALELFDQALALARAESLRVLEGFCLANRAVCRSRMRDQLGYLAGLNQALAVWRGIGRTQQVGFVLNSQAFHYIRAGRLDRAEAALAEAWDLLSAGPRNRVVSTNRRYAGDLALRQGRVEDASACYAEGWRIAERLRQADLAVNCRRGQGQALSRLGRGAEALALMGEALALARETGNRVEGIIETLRAMAECHLAHGLPAADGTPAPLAAKALLEEALAVAEEVEGYTPPAEMRELLASILMAEGDHRAAAAQLAAALAAVRVGEDTERQERMAQAQADAELERARAMADVERRRAEEAASEARTLAMLGGIGQEVTASLELERVFETLHGRLGGLLDAPIVGIALLREADRRLDMPFLVAEGRRLHPVSHPLDSPSSLAARCLREGGDLLLAEEGEIAAAPLLPGLTRRPRTVAWQPLSVQGRMLGALTCQSFAPNAYGPRELDIIRTLSSYGAIALANAAAYEALDKALSELRETQARLVQQEKMAALGQLVAGVAHEVNTPVGIALSAATNLRDAIDRADADFRAGKLKRSALEELFADGREGTVLIERNAKRASQLISSFKEVAVDQTSDQRRQVQLGRYLEEVVTSLTPRLRRSGHAVRVEAPADLAVDSYPGALAQIVTNLVVNAVDHGFAPGEKGGILIEAAAQGAEMIRLTVTDTGRGVAPDIRARIFDPFFTTRRSQGNTGLGLHLVYNLATRRLGGGIAVESPAEGGTRFVVTFPRVAPQPQQGEGTEGLLTEP